VQRWRGSHLLPNFRTRLAVLASLAVAMVIVAIAFIAFVGAEHIVLQSTDNTLAKQASNAIGSAESSNSPLARNDFYGNIAWVISEVGSHSGDPLPVTQEVQSVASGLRGAYFATVTVHGAIERELVTPVPVGLTVEGSAGPVPLPFGGALQLTTPLQEVDRELNLLRIGIILAALAGIAAAAGIGWAVARAAIRPLDKLTQSVESISTALDGTTRLDPGADDELGKLRRAFNRLLDAVASSRASQRQLVLDASHELRTPLTSLRTNVEVIPRVAELPVGERELIYADMLSEIEELTNLVGNLTELVRGDQDPTTPVGFWLNEVVQLSLDSVAAYSHTRSITIKSDLTRCCVFGHPDRIGTAVSNLLSNAIKWGPVGSTVEVICADGEVKVRDEGPGISAEDLPYIFNRFYRSSAARALPGSGLGLAIVSQAVTGDDGTVTVSNGDAGGTEFVIWLRTSDGCPQA
jgi:two-component system sensor histidine kinase MprB